MSEREDLTTPPSAPAASTAAVMDRPLASDGDGSTRNGPDADRDGNRDGNGNPDGPDGDASDPFGAAMLPADAGTAAEMRRAMVRETLVSEQLRSHVLAGMIGFGLLLYLAVAYVPGLCHGAMRDNLRHVVPTMLPLILGAMAYELVVGAHIGHLIRHGKQTPRSWSYVGSAIEISFPSLAILCWAGAFDTPSALGSVSSMFYLLFILFSVLRVDFWLCAFTGMVAAVQYLLVAWVLLSRGDEVSTLAGAARGMALRMGHLSHAPAFLATTPRSDFLLEPAHHALAASLYATAGLVAGFVAVRIRRQFAQSVRLLEERNRVVNLFGQHVSPAVVEKLLHQPVDQGEVRHVCVMFLDIRDFTRFAEQRRPEEVVDYLNRLFSQLIDVVNAHKGIVNKFLGDGFMAVFGAPIGDGQDSCHAVEAAMQIIRRTAELNSGGVIPPTRLGIGLHAGEAVTGNVGSKSRKEYTIIGSVVNLASRIEQLNKKFGTQVLASQTVWCNCGPRPPPADDLGEVPVKGCATPVRLYKLA